MIQHRTFNAIEDAIWNLGETLDIPGQPGATLYLFPGGAGRDGCLNRLAKQCPAAAGLETISFGSWQEWVRDRTAYNDLVTKACHDIMRSGRSGDTILAGYSQGGQMAYAVALALHAQGHPVHALHIFDSVAGPGATEAGRSGTWQWLIRHVRSALGSLVSGQTGPVPAGSRPVGAEEPLKRDVRTEIALRLGEILPDRVMYRVLDLPLVTPDHSASDRLRTRLDNKLQMQIFALLWKRWWRKHAAEAKPLSLRATLFRSRETGSEDLGWRPFLPLAQIVPSQGDHISMIDGANLPGLAVQFADAIGGNDPALTRTAP